MASKKKQPILRYILSDWRPCLLLWSDKWPDSETGVRGSAYYSTNGVNNDSYKVEQGKHTFNMRRVYFPKSDEESPPCLQLDGGRATFKVFPKRAYMNINQSYKGLPFMSEEDYDAEVQAGTMVNASVVPITKQPAQLD